MYIAQHGWKYLFCYTYVSLIILLLSIIIIKKLNYVLLYIRILYIVEYSTKISFLFTHR